MRILVSLRAVRGIHFLHFAFVVCHSRSSGRFLKGKKIDLVRDCSLDLLDMVSILVYKYAQSFLSDLANKHVELYITRQKIVPTYHICIKAIHTNRNRKWEPTMKKMF